MPRAICQKCGQEVQWSNTRGSRLSSLTHGYGCGGALKRPPRAADARPRGQQVRCMICGRKRFVGRNNVYQTTNPHRWWKSGAWINGEPPVSETRPGDFVCWGHATITANSKTYGPCAAELARAGKL